MDIIRHLIRYLKQELWKTQVADLTAPRRYFVMYLKIVLLAAREFRQDRANVRASALTLYSLLSIVPVMALVFGIAKGFGLENLLQGWLYTQFPQQRQLMEQAMVFAMRTLENAQGGWVAGAGVVFLIYTVVSMIGNIESAFNQIWSIAKQRSWSRKFSDYLSLILVGPFLILGASSLNVYVGTVVSRAAEAAPLSALLSPVARLALSLGPFLLLWILFSFTYVFLPATKVRLLSGLLGGAVAALLYQVVQSFYIDLQVGVSRANAIYGSFAALPLFLIWLQLSWNIVLFGAELTYHHQNFDVNEKEERLPVLSFRAIKRLSLGICDYVVVRFLRGEPPPTGEQISLDLRIPMRVLNDILVRLIQARILAETPATVPEENAYLPARDPHLITPVAIMEALESQGENLENAEGEAAWERYSPLLDAFSRCVREHPSNRPLGERAEGKPA